MHEEGSLGRRRFLARLAQVGALGAVGETVLTAQAFAQPATVPATPAGTVPNSAVIAQKHPGMQMHSDRPLTGSVAAELHDFDVTPTDRMFVRNNLLTPDLGAGPHMLRVNGLVDKPIELSLADLKKMPAVTMQGMLECAGSGRAAYAPKASGTSWLPTGGMGCPKWTGARLADVLKMAGVKEGAVHVAFSGEDFGAVATAPKVIRSIPLWKAMEENTLLAWAMNGEDLPKIHGYPLRVIVPGWVGSASTKWVSGIEVLSAPYKGTYMDSSYRVPPYPVKPGDKMPSGSVSAEAWPVKSIITHPAPEAVFKQGYLMVVRGQAWAGENQIARVDLSFDEGVTWERARLERGDKYAWRRFSMEVGAGKPGYMTILARATDDRGNTQPLLPAWNPLGYFWNGVHRVGIFVEKA